MMARLRPRTLSAPRRTQKKRLCRLTYPDTGSGSIMDATRPDTLPARLDALQRRIRHSCEAAGRDPAGVSLLAVSKTRHADDIRALAALGVTDIGENYLQEALPKQAALADLPLTWHFIGPIQSNKTRDIASH